MSEELLQRLFQEYAWYYGQVIGHRVPLWTSFSGVRSDGVQFLARLDGDELAAVYAPVFFKAVVDYEGLAAYAVAEGSLTTPDESGKREEMLQIWVADRGNFISGAWRVQRDDSLSIVELELLGTLDGDDPERYPQAALLTNVASVPEEDRAKCVDLWLKLRSGVRFSDRPDFAALLLTVRPPTVGGVAFPSSLGDLELRGVIDNEKATPGLGTTLKYGAPFIKASVFIYDFRMSNIPDGVDSAEVQEQFAMATSNVLGLYPDTQFLEREQRLVVGDVPLLSSAFQYTEAKPGSRELVNSFLYMTASGGRFFKVGITYPVKGELADLHARQIDFIERLCGLLRPKQGGHENEVGPLVRH